MTVTHHDANGAKRHRIYLAVGGMTCGACVRHVEMALNQISGVSASVDLATHTATVDVGETISVADLCAAVEDAGYTATECPDLESAAALKSGSAGLVARIPALLHQLMTLPLMSSRARRRK